MTLKTTQIIDPNLLSMFRWQNWLPNPYILIETQKVTCLPTLLQCVLEIAHEHIKTSSRCNQVTIWQGSNLPDFPENKSLMLHRWVRTSFKVCPRYARTSFEVCTSIGVRTSIGPRPRPAYMGAWLPGSHRVWSLWVPKHWEWIPSLMFLFIGNFKMLPQNAGTDR